MDEGVVKMEDLPVPPPAGSTTPPSIEEQKESITKAYDEASMMQAGDSWYPISARWWSRWKQYVGYDINGGDTFMQDDDWHPGKMDNTELLADGETGEMKKNLCQDIDLVWIPEPGYSLLKEWYGGGPDFPRRVIELGIQKETKIEMYPYFLEVTSADAKEFWNTTKERHHDGVVCDSTMLVSEAIKQVCKAASIPLEFAKLYLVFENTKEEADAAGMEYPGAPVTATMKAEPMLTPIDEKAYADQERTLQDILFGQTRIKVFIESSKWRQELKVGDLVDAEDDDHTWYDSRIIEVAEDGDKKGKVKLHFLCWESTWDAWLDIDGPRLAPLYSHAPDWRHFKVDMEVEVKMQDKKWYAARVVEVFEDKKMVKVNTTNDPQEVELAFDDESICRSGVHIKNKQPSTALVNRASNNKFAAGNGHVLGTSSSLNKNNPSSSYYSSSYSYGRGANTRGSPPVAGAVGLNNLGNTCFMNSMLQCLSNTKLLTEYFLAERHEAEVNVDNPLGTKGVLARVYAGLLKDMWSGENTIVAPTEFKRVIGNFAPQFAGYQQHDSQELMSFLLDGLHEDLNRVRQKPYIEVKDYDGEPDAQLAAESWQRHLMRNDSVVVDSCQGQLKSHVTCPKCGYESVTFDPYLSLSLPLPLSNMVRIAFTYYPLPLGSTPMKVKAAIPSNGSVQTLKEWMLTHLINRGSKDGADDDDSMAVDARPLQVLDVQDIDQGKVLRNDWEKRSMVELGRPKSYDLHAYELEEAPKPQEVIVVTAGFSKRTTSSYSFYQKHNMPFMAPVRISINATYTYHDVHARIWAVCQRFLKDIVEYADAPYRVYVANNGTPTDTEIPDSDEVVSFDTFKTGSIVVIIDQNAYWDCVDEDQLKRSDSHPTVLRRDSNADGKKIIPIKQCFETFAEREQLGEEDLWYCNKCKERLQAYKKMDVWSLPDILILHLKRFSYVQGYSISREKIEDLVTFPLEGLDLSDLMRGPVDSNAPPVYDLYAVSEHMGGLGGGHYTAVGKNYKNDTWYSFNDSYVSPIDEHAVESTVVSSRAYVLFYKRRHGSMRWAGAKPVALSSQLKKEEEV